ncbi:MULTISPECIES: hypothetical protein [unclassified Microcoleus]|uniref:hypothetical protein n=1 Tax=unclassified Microcoleus TaxID=2642155 RepID=UPI002FD04549
MTIKPIFHNQRLESDSAAKNCCMREWNTGITAIISTSLYSMYRELNQHSKRNRQQLSPHSLTNVLAHSTLLPDKRHDCQNCHQHRQLQHRF